MAGVVGDRPGMEFNEESRSAEAQLTSGPDSHPARWSIARVIELLDAAIDSAGAQLARSEGLRFDWSDDSAVLPARRRGSRRSTIPRAWGDGEDQEMQRGIEPP